MPAQSSKMLVGNLVFIDSNLGKGVDVFNDDNICKRLEEALMSKSYNDTNFQTFKNIMAKKPC